MKIIAWVSQLVGDKFNPVPVDGVRGAFEYVVANQRSYFTLERDTVDADKLRDACASMQLICRVSESRKFWVVSSPRFLADDMGIGVE